MQHGKTARGNVAQAGSSPMRRHRAAGRQQQQQRRRQAAAALVQQAGARPSAAPGAETTFTAARGWRAGLGAQARSEEARLAAGLGAAAAAAGLSVIGKACGSAI